MHALLLNVAREVLRKEDQLLFKIPTPEDRWSVTARTVFRAQ